LKKALGITLPTTTGLLNESQFKAQSGFSNISGYCKKGLIAPVGYGLSRGGTNGISHFFHPRQIKELRKALGITLTSTRGLLFEKEFQERSGIYAIAACRERGLIRPVGYGLKHAGVGPFYHPRQIKELQRKLAAERS
jgi:hypothetical protein